MALTSAQLNNAMNHFNTGLGTLTKGFQVKKARDSAQSYNEFATGVGLAQNKGPEAMNKLYARWTQGYQKGLRGTELEAFALQGGPDASTEVAPVVAPEIPATQQVAPTTGLWGQGISKEQKENYANKLLQGVLGNSQAQLLADQVKQSSSPGMGLPNFDNFIPKINPF